MANMSVTIQDMPLEEADESARGKIHALRENPYTDVGDVDGDGVYLRRGYDSAA
jgi:hypothetical protein